MRKFLYGLSAAATAAMLTHPAPVSSKAHASAKASTSAAISSVIEADRALSGTFQAGAKDSAIISALDSDIAMFVIPVAGLARTPAEAEQHLVKRFGEGPSQVKASPIRYGISADRSQAFSYGFMDWETVGKPSSLPLARRRAPRRSRLTRPISMPPSAASPTIHRKSVSAAGSANTAGPMQ